MSGRTEEQIAEWICRDDDAFQAYLAGYANGHLAGQDHMTLNNDQIVELAARRLRVLTFLDEEIRETMRTTREFIDVKAARERDAR